MMVMRCLRRRTNSVGQPAPASVGAVILETALDLVYASGAVRVDDVQWERLVALVTGCDRSSAEQSTVRR
jgi:hypothetical protein